MAEGLAPIQNWVKQLVDTIILTEFAAPDLEFQWRDDRESDPQKLASVAQTYVTNGIKTINEVRADIGLDPVAGGDVPMIFTGTGPIPLAKAAGGGEAAEKREATRLDRAPPLVKYSDDQPRDERGQWTSGGGGEPATATSDKPVRVAANDTGVRSDAGAAPPAQTAAGSEAESESGRGGRGLIEEEFLDAVAPVREALFYSALSRLRSIDPSNPQASFVAPPNWVPRGNDVQAVREALDTAIENAAANAAEHSYEKHVIVQREFPEVGSEIELELMARRIIKNEIPEQASRGRTLFWEAQTKTLVIVNTRFPSQSSIYRASRGRGYVDDILSEKPLR